MEKRKPTEENAMFRNMKHDRCRISVEETENYLREENWGVLSLHGDDGFPYGVPMNYVWDNGSILLHCASGNSHRLDSLKRSSKVCFTVVPEHKLDRQHWTTVYTSIIIFGTAELITDPTEKQSAMRAFMTALIPEKLEEAIQSCDPGKPGLVMIRIRPLFITGKQN